MQGDEENLDGGGCWDVGSLSRRCTSSEDYLPGCTSRGLIDSPIKSTATCKSAPPALPGPQRSAGDGKTRRYVRSREPRLKWSEDLHQSFIRAIEKLGGPEKATPKAILQAMNIRGLKIAHVKSHLQMFRNPKTEKNYGLQPDFSFWPPGGRRGQLHPDHVSEDQRVWDFKCCQASDQGTNSQNLIQRFNRHEPGFEGSWRPTPRAAIQPITNMIVNSTDYNSCGREADSGNFLGCCTALESSTTTAQLNHMPSQLSTNASLLSSDHITREMPEVFREAYPSFWKMMEVLESRGASKLRDSETLADQLLAGDADATRLYNSAELLAHNLLMAMRERRLLESGEQSSANNNIDTHSTVFESEFFPPAPAPAASTSCMDTNIGGAVKFVLDSADEIMLHPNTTNIPADSVPLELTMSVGVDPDVRPEILTLDLTGQFNTPYS